MFCFLPHGRGEKITNDGVEMQLALHCGFTVDCKINQTSVKQIKFVEIDNAGSHAQKFNISYEHIH